MTPYKLNKTDSRFFNQNIIAWHAEKTKNVEELEVLEKEIQQKFNPAMITAFLPVGDIQAISHFSACNYRFIECRLLVEKEFSEAAGAYSLYPFEFVEVTCRKQLNALKKACAGMVFDDRFFTDPKIDNLLALERNLFFLEQSYKRKNEFIYILQNNATNEILGFRSFKLPSPTEATMLINGFVQDRKDENIRELINLFELELLFDLGIRLVKAVISVQNYDEINRYLSKYGYKIYDSKVLLRKIVRGVSSKK